MSWVISILVLFLVLHLIRYLVMPICQSRSAESRGARGEAELSKLLKNGLHYSDYHILHDIMLPTDEDETTQVDHIVVSRFGVFVIEAKNYSGWIFGDERSRTWIKTFPGGRRYRFQNPLHQNFRHTKTMESLGVPATAVKSVIAFSRDATFKTTMPPNVLYFDEVSDYILSFGTPLINDRLVETIVNALLNWNRNIDPEARKNHVANLQRRHAGRLNSGAQRDYPH